MGDMRILPMGQSAMLVELDGLDAAMALFAAIEACRTGEIAGPYDGVRYDVFAGVREVVPAARTVLVRFDPLLTDRGALSVVREHQIIRVGDRRKLRIKLGQFDIDPVIGSLICIFNAVVKCLAGCRAAFQVRETGLEGAFGCFAENSRINKFHSKIPPDK